MKQTQALGANPQAIEDTEAPATLEETRRLMHNESCVVSIVAGEKDEERSPIMERILPMQLPNYQV